MTPINGFNKVKAIDYAVQVGWTKADAERAFKSLSFPMGEIEILNAMVRFAGPELIERQRKQAAQKAQVTIKTKLLDNLSKQFVEMNDDYEEQIKKERSNFVPLLKKVYGFAQKFGYRDAWIESLLVTYKQYTEDKQDEAA